LNEILKNTNMTFQIQNNRVIISQQVTEKRVVSGTVSDEFGEPIIGASIMVKGKTAGTITDFDGNFSLEVDPKDILSISYIGYLTQEYNPVGQSTLLITMREDTQKLDEVVVIGYGVVKKKDLTGSVASLKMQDIAAVPVSNALEALQGKISGLDMTRASGEAGSSLGFSLRGNRSLSASNEPLILVDGIQYGNTVDINTSDIESIQVLKDASSTAIYGSRGANGVILITTKKGQIGKPVVSFNMYAGVQSDAGLADIQSGEEWVAFRKEAYRTNGITDESLIFNAAELEFINNGDYINWQDICVGNGSLQNYEVSLSGGTELSTFNFSLGVYDEKGLLANDNLRRYNGMLSGDYKLFNNVKIGANIMYTYRDNNKRQDPLNQANKIIPLGKVYDENGEINIYPASNTSISPIADEIEDNYVNNTIGKRMFSTSYLDWDILPGLKFKTTLGLDMQDYRQGIYYGQYTINGAGNQSHSSIENTTEQRLTWENILNWNKSIKKHDFTVLLGHSVTDYLKETAKAEGSNQVSATTSFHDLAGNASDKAIESSRLEERMVSFFGRVNYKFNEKYLLTASLRGDGASQLAAGNKWGYFPSTAVAWRINEESFLENVDVLSDLKLRASWGISGNSAIDAYSTLGSLGSSTYAFGENPAYGYYPATISNPDLKWEKTTTYNLGVDFGFFNGRISGVVELYLSNTKDLLMERIIPATSGYTLVMENIGKTRNKGVEVTLSTVNIDNRRPGGFKWNTDLTFYRNKEEIVELMSGVERDLSNGWFVGSPTEVFYDYEKIGIWQLGEEEEAAKYGQVPGDIKVKDQNGDGQIDADNDRVIVGTSRPKFTMSMNNRFSYKNLI
ncbi:MAG: TonB-dependent receptor, partial [Tannerellaceae bacterium]|nr:TonB-dependent receptor [Tannerellaceae bacterium]